MSKCICECGYIMCSGECFRVCMMRLRMHSTSKSRCRQMCFEDTGSFVSTRSSHSHLKGMIHICSRDDHQLHVMGLRCCRGFGFDVLTERWYASYWLIATDSISAADDTPRHFIIYKKKKKNFNSVAICDVDFALNTQMKRWRKVQKTLVITKGTEC